MRRVVLPPPSFPRHHTHAHRTGATSGRSRCCPPTCPRPWPASWRRSCRRWRQPATRWGQGWAGRRGRGEGPRRTNKTAAAMAHIWSGSGACSPCMHAQPTAATHPAALPRAARCTHVQAIADTVALASEQYAHAPMAPMGRGPGRGEAAGAARGGAVRGGGGTVWDARAQGRHGACHVRPPRGPLHGAVWRVGGEGGREGG